MKASDLKFDTPYNAAVSLNIIAEQIKRMDWNVSKVDFRLRERQDTITIVIGVPPPARRRIAPTS